MLFYVIVLRKDTTSIEFHLLVLVFHKEVSFPQYNLYTSDQPTSANTIVADYANDKLIISINEKPIVASLNLQNHLSLMETWYKNWRIKVNKTKCNHTTSSFYP